MKRYLHFTCCLILLTWSCDSGDETNLPPADFVVSAEFVTKNSAQLIWTPATDPDGDSIYYEVRLQGTSVASKLLGVRYNLLNLNSAVEYTAEVVAVDPTGNETLASVTFKTPGKKIFTGNVTLRSQLEVNAFGANNYDEIHGSLWIGGVCRSPYDCNPTSISDLSTLKSITRITSNLNFELNSTVINLDGLENLEEVGSLSMTGVRINENSKAFNKIDSIKGSVYLWIPANTTAGGLNNLNYVGGQFGIQSFKAAQLTEFQNLTQVGGIYILTSSITDLNGLTKLAHVEGSLEISSNSKLTDLCGLNTLISSNGLTGTYKVFNNAHNPTITDLTNGNCKK
jgi:hypothetical protein